MGQGVADHGPGEQGHERVVEPQRPERHRQRLESLEETHGEHDLLAGDALLTEAFAVIVRDPGLDPWLKNVVVAELARAAGSRGISAVGRFLAARGLTGVDLLPYHRAGLAKYGRLGLDYALTDIVSQRFDAGVRLGEQVAKDAGLTYMRVSSGMETVINGVKVAVLAPRVEVEALRRLRSRLHRLRPLPFGLLHEAPRPDRPAAGAHTDSALRRPGAQRADLNQSSQ